MGERLQLRISVARRLPIHRGLYPILCLYTGGEGRDWLSQAQSHTLTQPLNKATQQDCFSSLLVFVYDCKGYPYLQMSWGTQVARMQIILYCYVQIKVPPLLANDLNQLIN